MRGDALEDVQDGDPNSPGGNCSGRLVAAVGSSLAHV